MARVRHTTYSQAVLLDSFFLLLLFECLLLFLAVTNQMRLTRCSVKACLFWTCLRVLDYLNFLLLSFPFLSFPLFVLPTRRGANCISLIVCRCLGTCVFGQVPLLPRLEMWGNRTACSLHWLRMGDPGVTCTLCALRTLLVVQLGNAWPFLSRGWGSKGSNKSQIIPLDHASKHTPWLDTCLLCFSRGEPLHFSCLLQTRVPDCRMSITISALIIGAVLHFLCCFPMFPHYDAVGGMCVDVSA